MQYSETSLEYECRRTADDRNEGNEHSRSPTDSTLTLPQPLHVNPIVYFYVAIGGQPLGRMEFELSSDICPKTCLNFRTLCNGEWPEIGSRGKRLTYKGSTFHRVIPHFMLQGGDITKGDGRGGDSIYGGYFGDENFILKHQEPGMLAMANNGPNTNSSQFYITTVPCPWLDGKNVVFGKLISGEDIVAQLESFGTPSGKPTVEITIVDCGEIR